MSDLTKKQKEVLQYIIRFKEVNQYPPTIREIQQGVYNGSFQTISDILVELREKGYITYKDKCPRTIKVIRF